MHEDVHETAQWLGKVVNGWLNYGRIPDFPEQCVGKDGL